LNSKSKETSLPYPEEFREFPNNFLADNVPTSTQEPVAFTVNPVQEPVTVRVIAVQEPVQAPTVQTPVTVQATPAKVLPPLSILTPPSHSGSTFAKEKAKMSSDHVCKILK